MHNVRKRARWVGTGFSVGHSTSIFLELVIIIYVVGSEVLVAMRADDNGGTIDNIRKTVHIHPALSEVVSRAAANIHGI